MSHIFVSSCFVILDWNKGEQLGVVEHPHIYTVYSMAATPTRQVCPNTVVDLLEMNNLDRAMDEKNNIGKKVRHAGVYLEVQDT